MSSEMRFVVFSACRARSAFSRRHACHGPAKYVARAASSSSVAVVTASRNQRSCATMTQAAPSSSSFPSSHSRLATSRWFVGSSRSSRSGSPASVRASEARVTSPPEKVSSRRSRSASAKLVFGRGRLACASYDVGLEGEGAVEGRPLVVERHARALRERELAAVDRRFPGEHAEERRLAGTVWTEQGKTITAADRERNLLKERFAGKFLAETRGNHDGHGPIVAERRWREPTGAETRPRLVPCHGHLFRPNSSNSSRSRTLP